MAWTRIDDKYLTNIKIRKAGALGMALYLAGLIHCNSNLTDGYIDDDMLPLLYGLSFQSARNKCVEKLVELKLWHRKGNGYQVNDFLDFNRSKGQIEVIKAKRAESGSKGGSKPRAKDEPNQEQSAKQIAKPELKINTLSPNTLSPKELKDKRAAAVSEKNSEIYSQFEAITPVDDRLKTALDSAVNIYSVSWVRDAITEATGKGRTFGYVNSILERWKRDGRNGKKPARVDTGSYEAWTNGGTK